MAALRHINPNSTARTIIQQTSEDEAAFIARVEERMSRGVQVDWIHFGEKFIKSGILPNSKLYEIEKNRFILRIRPARKSEGLSGFLYAVSNDGMHLIQKAHIGDYKSYMIISMIEYGFAYADHYRDEMLIDDDSDDMDISE